MARFYGWSRRDLDQYLLDEVVSFYESINELEDKEIQKRLDVISFPHATKATRERIIKRYFSAAQQKTLPGTKEMAMKYSSNVRRQGQTWPKGK